MAVIPSRTRFARTRSDPTLVRNQPALQTSPGTIWLIVGGLFLAVCLVPLSGIALDGPPAGLVAIVTIVILVALYAAMVAVRLSSSPGPRRLRRMAFCFLGMAGVALIGMIVCVLIQWNSLFPA